MKDIIDERNERERISKSIIKYWNVNYVIPEVPQETKEAEETADIALDDEIMGIIDRADEDEIWDEAEEQAALLRAGEEYLKEEKAIFNKTTGSYSGAYGRKEVEDEETKGQIDAILHARSDALRDLIARGTEEEK